MPQNPQTLFVKKTVREDLLEALRAKSTDVIALQQIETIAAQCRISSVLEQHPYDLSGGEQQRAALAKVLLRKPDILLLDEPTKGCDALFKQTFAEILHELQQNGMTVVMVSHDIEFCARYAQRCMLFFDGAVIAENDAQTFFSGNRFYTTAANRMARHLLPYAVLPEDIIYACGAEFHNTEWYNREEMCYGTKHSESVYADENMKSSAKIEKITPNLSDKQKIDRRTLLTILFAFLLIPVTLWIGLSVQGTRQYYITALLVLIESMVPFIALFEGRKPMARELVIVSVLCAIAIAGRALFFMLPQIKPVLAIVIVSGAALGCETGMLVGAMSMLVSNLLFAQGPWTPWQMFAMGMIGGLAGIVFCRKPWQKNRIALCVFGAISAIALYGVIMNLSTALLYNSNMNASILAAYLISGFPMDCMHGIATAVFLWIAAEPMLEKLERLQLKYGCF